MQFSKSMKTWFERAIFISWYCAKPSCKFCFMFTIKDQIKRPRKARRRLESILAEALICKICNWKIGFISAGIASWNTSELQDVLEGINKITREKQWLNLGVMKERQIKNLLPYIKGITGTVETVNWKLRQEVVPDKPLDEIEKMFIIADKYNLKKSITIIIGLGETIDDFPNLADIIKKWNIDRINFYRLVPHKNTPFTSGPATEYYAAWISKTRKEFPNLQIIAGSWPDKTYEIPDLLMAGADAITKFPAIKLFSSKEAHEIEAGVKKAGRKFLSNLTKYPKVDVDAELRMFDDDLRQKIKGKYMKYYRKMHS